MHTGCMVYVKCLETYQLGTFSSFIDGKLLHSRTVVILQNLSWTRNRLSRV